MLCVVDSMRKNRKHRFDGEKKLSVPLARLVFLTRLTMSYAAAVLSSPSKKISKLSKVQKLLKAGNYFTQRQIAETVGCHTVYVAQIKKSKLMAEQPPWYQKHVSKGHEFDPSGQPITYTSNLSSQVPLREISREELAKHNLIIRGEGARGERRRKQSLRRALFQGAHKESFHGFVEVKQTMSEEDSELLDTILNTKLPAMLAKASYEECFATIFEFVQLAPLGPGEMRGDDKKEDDRRMGDKKRSQAKLSALLQTASERVKNAQSGVDKCTRKSGKEKRGVDSALASAKRDEALLLDLLRLMRKHYDCIREVRKSILMLNDETLQ
jgi:Holliday junction resolvase-like predicted endonuclease